MKKLLYSMLMIFALSLSVSTVSSCREDKSAGEEVEDGMEEAADEVEDAADETTDEVEDAVDGN